MNSLLRHLLIFVFVTGFGTLLPGATYYVDFDSGNDDNAGTSPEAAFKHSPGEYAATAGGAPAPAAEEAPAEAKEEKTENPPGMAPNSNSGDSLAAGKAKGTKLQPGDVVIFKGGVSYRGILKNSASGQEKSPIIFDGNTEGKFGAGRAIIEGSEAVAGWKKCTSAKDALGNKDWTHLWYTDEVPADADPYLINLCQGEKMMYVAVFPCSDARHEQQG